MSHNVIREYYIELAATAYMSFIAANSSLYVIQMYKPNYCNVSLKSIY